MRNKCGDANEMKHAGETNSVCRETSREAAATEACANVFWDEMAIIEAARLKNIRIVLTKKAITTDNEVAMQQMHETNRRERSWRTRRTREERKMVRTILANGVNRAKASNRSNTAKWSNGAKRSNGANKAKSSNKAAGACMHKSMSRTKL